MKRFSIITLAIGLALLPGIALAQAAPSGSYQQSCQNIRVRGDMLHATCSSTNGRLVRSRLDLSTCRSGLIGNNNGRLFCNGANRRDRDDQRYNGNGYGRDRDNMQNGRRAVPQGSYLQSCQNAYMRGGQLVATCTSANGQHIQSSLDVNNCPASDIGNVNGRLRCVRNNR